MTEKLPPIHPGEILKTEFLEPLGISQNRLALAMRVPAPQISEIVLGKRSVTANTAIRLAIALKTDPEFWMRIQSRYDLETAQDKYGEVAIKEVAPVLA
jgi:addiction module HigA family antidote